MRPWSVLLTEGGPYPAQNTRRRPVPGRYCEQNSVFKAVGPADLNVQAWNNKGSTTLAVLCWCFAPEQWAMWARVVGGGPALPTRERHPSSSPGPSGSIGATRGDTYCPVRGEILRPGQDELLRRHFSSVPSLIKNESVGIEDDQIPS